MFVQNYLRFSLDDNVFSIKVFPPKGKVESPSLEAEKSAYYFYKQYKTRKLILCMSGGLDSEVMAESFLRAGVPFSVSIWEYKNGFNNYDIKHAIKFCNKHKIDYETEICDLEQFYENNLHNLYGQKYLCNTPQVVVHLHLLEKVIKKTKASIAVFLPWQPPNFYFDKKKEFNVRIIWFRYLAYHRFFALNALQGSPYFLICRSALFYSWLNLPIVKYIMNSPYKKSILNRKDYKIKTLMYEQGGFLSKPKKGKFTGFDKLKSSLTMRYGIIYNEAFRYPLIKMIPDPTQEDVYISPYWKNQ